MTSIAPTGRPKLPSENPSQGSTPQDNVEKNNDDSSDLQKHLQNAHEEDMSAEDAEMSTQKETEAVEARSDSLIKESKIGILNWNLEHALTHGYYNKRDVDENEVQKLTKAVQAHDRRHNHPLYAAVDKAELEKLGIQLSQDPETAPTLTPEQLAALQIIAIAGQHRQMSGQEILTMAKQKLAALKAELERLLVQLDDHEVAVEGEQEGALGSKGEKGFMVPGEAPQEPAADGEESILDVSEQTLGDRSAAADDVKELKDSISWQEKEVERVRYWPMVLVDKSKLPADSNDAAVITALMSLSSNKLVQQNAGARHEPWMLVQPILATPKISMAARIKLAVKEMSGPSVALMNHGPMRHLIYTLLRIPALRSEFDPHFWRRVLNLPVATLVILVIQASLDNLLEVFAPEAIEKSILSLLDQAYEETIRDSWCRVVCDLESSDDAAPLSKYIANIKEQLSAEKPPQVTNKYLKSGGREVLVQAFGAVEKAVKDGKAPLYCGMLRQDTIENVPSVADAFVWAERYFSADAGIYGSFTQAKGKNKRPDPAFAVINELLREDKTWESELQDAKKIIPRVVVLAFGCAREASGVIAKHMNPQPILKLPDIPVATYTGFNSALATKAGAGTFTATTTSEDASSMDEDELAEQLKAVAGIINAIDKDTAKRLNTILKDGRHSKLRFDLATRLFYFIHTCTTENNTILEYAAVVKFMRGLMSIGIGRDNTPCLIAGQIPATNKDGLKSFQIPLLDKAIWDPLEKHLKSGGKAVTTALSLLPKDKTPELVREWTAFLQKLRGVYKDDLQSKPEYVNESFPSNPSNGMNYIAEKKTPNAPSSTASKPVKQKGEKAVKDSTKNSGKTGEGKGSTNNGSKSLNKQPSKKARSKRKTEDVSDGQGLDEDEEGGTKRARTAK